MDNILKHTLLKHMINAIKEKLVEISEKTKIPYEDLEERYLVYLIDKIK